MQFLRNLWGIWVAQRNLCHFVFETKSIWMMSLQKKYTYLTPRESVNVEKLHHGGFSTLDISVGAMKNSCPDFHVM